MKKYPEKLCFKKEIFKKNKKKIGNLILNVQ